MKNNQAYQPIFTPVNLKEKISEYMMYAQATDLVSQWMPPKDTKLGSKNWTVREIGEKLAMLD